MNYNHSKKAGNYGDVWKHFVLVTLAKVIARRSRTFRYVESHCGAPVHELVDRGEWEKGIGRIIQDAPYDNEYFTIAREWMRSKQYPAGWVFMIHQLAGKFEEIEVHLFDICDRVEESYKSYQKSGIPDNSVVRFSRTDGYEAVKKLEEFDLVFMDPPYRSSRKDWRSLIDTCRNLKSRRIDFVVWYPFFWSTYPQKLVDNTESSAWEIHWRSCGSKPSQNMKGCGMLLSDNLFSEIRTQQTELIKISEFMKSKIVIRRPFKQTIIINDAMHQQK